MKEIPFDELSPEIQILVSSAVENNPRQCRFQVNGDEAPYAYRLPIAYAGKRAVKWGPLLDLETHEATGMPVSEPLMADPPSPDLQETLKSLGDLVTTGAAMEQVEGIPVGPIQKVEDGDLKMINYGLIDRCPLNPRKTFKRERLDELKGSFRAHRFVREMSHLWLRPSPTQPGRFELIDGERRWIVVGELIKEEMFGGLLPAMVSAVSDEQALEYALVNALQREELSSMEEAGAIALRIQISREGGRAGISNKELAEHLGCDERRIRRALLLHSLRGTRAGDEVESGRLPTMHAEVIAKVANVTKRDELTRRILDPSDKRGVFPLATLEQWIKDEVHIDLRNAEFDLLNPNLVPMKMLGEVRQCGGACAEKLGDGKNPVQWSCPFVEVKKTSIMCMNPDCFKAKQAVAYWAWCEQQAAKGYKTLPAAEAERMWDDSGKRVIANAGLVEMSATPEEWEIKVEVWKDAWKFPKWKALIKDRGVEVLALKDRTGAEHFLVNREKAKAAAVENAHDIFRGASSKTTAPAPEGQLDDDGSGDTRIEKAAEDVKAEAARQAEQAKREREDRIEDRYELLIGRSVVERTRGLKKLDFAFWRLIVAPMAETVKEQGNVLPVCLALGLHVTDVEIGMSDEGLMDWLNETIRGTPEVHLPSVALILARHMLYASEIEQWMKLAGKEYGVDAKVVRKMATEQIAAEIEKEKDAAEIASGIEWMNKRREKALEFEWDSDGGCQVPNVALVKMPKSVKHEAVLATARAAKGWSFGFSVNLGKKNLVNREPNRNEAVYDNEPLAVRAGLLAIQKAMEEHGAPEQARERVGAYIANVSTPDAPAKVVKALKKKGFVKRGTVATNIETGDDRG